MNAWNACAVCGEHVSTRSRMHGFTGWQSDDDSEIIGRETVTVVHPECWLRLTPAERKALLEARANGHDRG
jgi:hypothetical protein